MTSQGELTKLAKQIEVLKDANARLEYICSEQAQEIRKITKALDDETAGVWSEWWLTRARIVGELTHYQLTELSRPDASRRKKMRAQAITIFELTKGFTTETKDNAMKSAIEMAGYVMELTEV